MPNNTTPYNTYQQTTANQADQGYTEVERNTEYEYKSTFYFHGAEPIESKYYRKFETVTYEATLTEKLDDVHDAKYNENASVPDEDHLPTFPENNNTPSATGWKLQSIEYTKSLSTPLTRDCRITFIKQGNWIKITNNNNSGNSGN